MFEGGYNPNSTYTQFYANNYLYAVVPDNQFCCQQSILPMVPNNPDCYNLAQQVASAMKVQYCSIASSISSLNAQLERDMRQAIASTCRVLTLNEQGSLTSCCCEKESVKIEEPEPEYYL